MLNKKTLVILSFSIISFLVLILILLFLPKGEQFKLVTVNPAFTDPNYLYAPNLQVSLTFSQPVNPQKFSYTVTPAVNPPLRTVAEGEKIILKPNVVWPDGEYTLKIVSETTSSKNKKLDRDYIYQFKVGLYEHGAD